MLQNHHGIERDGGGKSQNRKGQDHGALSHGLDFDYASPNGKNIIMRISYFDALS